MFDHQSAFSRGGGAYGLSFDRVAHPEVALVVLARLVAPVHRSRVRGVQFAAEDAIRGRPLVYHRGGDRV